MRDPLRTAALAVAWTLLLAACGSSAAAAPSSPPAAAATAAATSGPRTLPPATPPSTTATPGASPSFVADTPVDYRPTDGKDDEHVIGTWTFLGTGPSTVTGHDAVTSFRYELNDPRVTGPGSLDFGLHMLTEAAPTWATMVVEGPAGSWKGDCTGAHWQEAGSDWFSGAMSCWLKGTEAYGGQVFYLQMLGLPDMRIDGVVYPGLIPNAETGY
jgi:hypothetical protein